MFRLYPIFSGKGQFPFKVSIFIFLTARGNIPGLIPSSKTTEGTLSIAIAGFSGQNQFTRQGYALTMLVLMLLPGMLIFILCQVFFVQGLTAGSTRG